MENGFSSVYEFVKRGAFLVLDALFVDGEVHNRQDLRDDIARVLEPEREIERRR